MNVVNRIVGGAFQDLEGNPLSFGYLLFQLTKDAQVSGTGQACAGAMIRVPLDANGNVAGVVGLWSNAIMTPTDAEYIISAYTAAGQLVWQTTEQILASVPLIYDPNVSGVVHTHSVRLRFDGVKVDTTDNAPPTVVLYNPNAATVIASQDGSFTWGEHTAVIDASGNLYGESGSQGTETFQVLNTLTGVQATRNIVEPDYESIGTGALGIVGTSPRIRVESAGTRIYVPLFWGGGILSAPRSQGIVAIIKPDLTFAASIPSVVSPVWASTFPILSQDIFNNIWILTQSATDNTYWLSRSSDQSHSVGPFNITAFVGTVAATTPLQYFNDGNGHLLFLMGDGSIQQWAITGDPNITFVQTINITGIRTNDTAILFERLQPKANIIRGGFFVSYTNGAGHAAIALVSLSTFSILETYDLSTVRFQDGSALPIASFRDADYNIATGDLQLVLAGQANTWKIPLGFPLA